MAESLLTSEARAWAGRAYPPVQVAITARDIAKFAHATGESDPIYFDAEAARAAGYAGVVAPAMFHLVLRSEPYHLQPREELADDGSAREDVPPMHVTRAMAGETQLTFNGRFVAGDVVTCHKRLVDIAERQGRSGPLVLLHFEYRYEVNGRAVVQERFTRIFR